jgi:hypothetical protein
MAFEMRWGKGQTPLMFKIVGALFVAGLLTAFLLLVWRDVCAPSTHRPGYDCISRGRHTAVYFVPCWFNLILHAGTGVAAVAFLLLPVIYGAYPHLHAPSRDENPSSQP